MTSFVFVAPYSPPSPPANPWPGVRIGWTGWDGSEWEFIGRNGVSLGPGTTGFSMPPVDRWTSESGSVPGSQYLGHRVRERPVHWVLSVFHDGSSQEWLARDRALWWTLQPGHTGEYWVEHPGPAGAERRYLTLRVDPSADDPWDFLPGYLGWHRYEIDLVAERPFWRGTLQTRAFSAPTGEPFFGGAGGGGYGPPFFISESSTLATAQIDNPGDLDVSPVWWVGESSSSSVGTVDVPFEVPAGKLLVIDEAPTAQTAILIDAPDLGAPIEEQRAHVAAALPSGVNVTKQLGATTRFGRVSPGASVNLDITLAGPGVVRVLLEPLYYRAW